MLAMLRNRDFGLLWLADFGAFNAHRLAGPGTPAVGMAMGWMGLAGFPVVAGAAGRQALVQSQAPDAYRGRVFGALSAVQRFALLIGLGVGVVLGDVIGIVSALSAIATLRVHAGLVALTLLPRHERRRDSQGASFTPRT